MPPAPYHPSQSPTRSLELGHFAEAESPVMSLTCITTSVDFRVKIQILDWPLRHFLKFHSWFNDHQSTIPSTPPLLTLQYPHRHFSYSLILSLFLSLNSYHAELIWILHISFFLFLQVFCASISLTLESSAPNSHLLYSPTKSSPFRC